MRINLKSFLVGAVVAAIPMSFVVYKSMPKPVPLNAFDSPNRLLSTDIAASLTITPSQAPVIPSPTATPKHIPQVIKTETIQEVASYEIRQPAPGDINVLIEKYSIQYGVDKQMMVSIAKCESGFRSNAVNGPYAGIYQFISSTWVSNRRAMGLDTNPELRFDPEESVRTAAFKMSRDGFGAWPVCSQKALSYKS